MEFTTCWMGMLKLSFCEKNYENKNGIYGHTDVIKFTYDSE